MATYNLCFKKDTEFYLDDCDSPYFVELGDIWTSVQDNREKVSINWLRHLGKDHIKQQISKQEFKSYRLWKHIDIDLVDIEVWWEGQRLDTIR